MLQDVASTCSEGRCCPLARHVYSHDGKRSKLQSCSGCYAMPRAARWQSKCLRAMPPAPPPWAYISTSYADAWGLPEWVGGQLRDARQRPHLGRGEASRVRLGPRCADRRSRSWHLNGALQLSLLDEHDLSEITSDAYPGERLVQFLCRPRGRARKREAPLQASEQGLERSSRQPGEISATLPARTKSAFGSAGSSGAKGRQTLESGDHRTTASPIGANSSASPKRRRWTASMSSAAACPRKTSASKGSNCGSASAFDGPTTTPALALPTAAPPRSLRLPVASSRPRLGLLGLHRPCGLHPRQRHHLHGSGTSASHDA